MLYTIRKTKSPKTKHCTKKAFKTTKIRTKQATILFQMKLLNYKVLSIINKNQSYSHSINQSVMFMIVTNRVSALIHNPKITLYFVFLIQHHIVLFLTVIYLKSILNTNIVLNINVVHHHVRTRNVPKHAKNAIAVYN